MRRHDDPQQNPLDSSAAGHGFDAYPADLDAEFRRHFEAALAGPGRTLEAFWPAYRFGYDLGTAEHGDDWAALEPIARRKWERGQPGAWEEFRDAVRYAWECARRRAA